MLKAGIKRRRTTQQIKDQKEEEALRQQAIEEKLSKFDEMMQKFSAVKEEADNGKAAAKILAEMWEKGDVVQDEEGKVVVKPQIIDQSEMSQVSQQQMQEDMIESSINFKN